MNQNERWMLYALKEAKKAYEIDEVPIGAIIVKNDMISISGVEHFYGTETIKVIAHDNYGGSDAQDVVIIVTPINDVPILDYIKDVEFDEETRTLRYRTQDGEWSDWIKGAALAQAIRARLTKRKTTS